MHVIEWTDYSNVALATHNESPEPNGTVLETTDSDERVSEQHPLVCLIDFREVWSPSMVDTIFHF